MVAWGWDKLGLLLDFSIDNNPISILVIGMAIEQVESNLYVMNLRKLRSFIVQILVLFADHDGG